MEGLADTRLVADLTEEQLALVAAMTEAGVATPDGFPYIPEATWNRRRWLGLDAPGALEAEWNGAPIWRSFAAFNDTHKMIAFLHTLPIRRRLEHFGEAALFDRAVAALDPRGRRLRFARVDIDAIQGDQSERVLSFRARFQRYCISLYIHLACGLNGRTEGWAACGRLR